LITITPWDFWQRNGLLLNRKKPSPNPKIDCAVFRNCAVRN
jgi:hypothetical protein